MKRRDFLKTAAFSTAAAAVDLTASTDVARVSNAAVLPRRAYGSTGEELSIVGFGGIVVNGLEQADANRIVAEAVERGVNYFDVAPSYGDAEMKLGPALKRHRDNVFLACKTLARDRDGAKAELDQSLERLQTDHFDLYQLHAISSVEGDVDAAFRDDGAMEVFLEARREGRVRYLGFSAHSVEAALHAMDRYDFDSALFPVNYACWIKGGFGPQIVAKAQEKGVACLALKALAKQQWPENHPKRSEWSRCWYEPLSHRHEAELGLRFTLGQPITAAIPPGDERLFRLAVDIASTSTLTALSDAEQEEISALASTMNPLFRDA